MTILCFTWVLVVCCSKYIVYHYHHHHHHHYHHITTNKPCNTDMQCNLALWQLRHSVQWHLLDFLLSSICLISQLVTGYWPAEYYPNWRESNRKKVKINDLYSMRRLPKVRLFCAWQTCSMIFCVCVCVCVDPLLFVCHVWYHLFCFSALGKANEGNVRTNRDIVSFSYCELNHWPKELCVMCASVIYQHK